MNTARPVVAVSACLLGEKVRYDGGDRRNPTIVGPLAEQMDLLPFCPEVAIGLSVPRPTLQLVQGEDSVRVLGVNNPALDVTDALSGYAQQMSEQLLDVSGVIFKCRSPSCGLNSTPLHDQMGKVIGTASGAFAAVIAARFVELPLAEEEELGDPQRYDRFVQRVLARHATR